MHGPRKIQTKSIYKLLKFLVPQFTLSPRKYTWPVPLMTDSSVTLLGDRVVKDVTEVK